MSKKHLRTRVVLLHNEKAGDEEHSTRDLEKMLKRHGYRPESFALKAALPRTDLLERGEFIVVAGGDGSVRRVATKLAHRGAALALLPLGTANNIASSLGIVGKPDEIIDGWADGSRRPMDLGLAKGPWGERRFIEGVGLGLIGRAITTLEEIDDVSSRELPTREDKLYRDLCVFLALAREFAPMKIGVTHDGRKRSGRFLLLEILNIDRAGPGVTLAKRADPSDGQLDLVTVAEDERDRLQENLRNHLAELREPAVLRSRRGRRFTLALHSGALRIDDEVVWPPPRKQAGRAPARATVEISVEAEAVELVLPKGIGR